ncbi:MAG: hypothetical protein IJZ42_01145 [Lachnospiraceae bacterium]|nr:hypothetical protein [Lachnospiraceae bacterium]
MEKDTRLVNIYLKIHNKRSLTVDDLRYLAEHDPECFEKTCKNVVYNLPQSKPIVDPDSQRKEAASAGGYGGGSVVQESVGTQFDAKADGKVWDAQSTFNARAVIKNLRRAEIGDTLFAGVDLEQVKDLLGNLYMELLFPHNDEEESFFDLMSEEIPRFDSKA